MTTRSVPTISRHRSSIAARSALKATVWRERCCSRDGSKLWPASEGELLPAVSNGHRDVLVGDLPAVGGFAEAEGGADPVFEFFAVGLGAAAVDEGEGEAHVFVGGDFEVVKFEESGAGSFGLPFIPAFSIG